MRYGAGIVVLLAVVPACARMQRQWEAQQAAAALAQPANVETVCRAGVQSYCSHCMGAGADCSSVYVACVGGRSTADDSGLTLGQANQCAADVAASDCGVMPATWPASCSTPDTQLATNSCPDGTQWDGTQCAASTTIVVERPTALRPPRRRQAPDCRAKVVEKGFGPSSAPLCDGAEPRCAAAVLDGGFGPDALAACRGVNAKCAVSLLKHGFGPSALGNCQDVDAKCAVAALDGGFGPGSLAGCKLASRGR